MGNYLIADVLNLAAIPTPDKGRPWTGQRVYQFLLAERPDVLNLPDPRAPRPSGTTRPARTPAPPTVDAAGAEHVAAQKAKRRASGK